MNHDSTRELLARLRDHVARSEREEALRAMDEIQCLGDPYSTSQGWIQVALLYQQVGAIEWAERALLDAAGTTEDHRPEESAEPQPEYLEVQLQLARAWQQVGRYDRARRAYALLLRDIPDRPRSSTERHILAIAEYRLADLRVEDAPQEACERWRRVVELHDEEVSPYAALRMALQLGSVHLVGERVEKLFHYAMGTRDPRLFSESALGLARHLKDCNQFAESRRYLRRVLAADCAEELTEQAGDELAKMDRYEAMVRTRKPLRHPWQLQMRAQRGAFARLDDSVRRVIIVGAGTGGSYLRASLDSERYFVCGFVDDGLTAVTGAASDPILGRIEDLTSLLGDIKPDEVLLAIPTLSGVRRRKVVLACREARTPLLNLPGMHELGIGWTRNEDRRSLMTQLRPVRIGETLGEERRALDLLATGWLQFKTVVVIGAGAIGAELCRRLVDAEVRRLVVVDQRESALRKIETELCDFRDFEAIEVRLGNATESGFLTGVFESCSPYVVFNATGNGSPQAFEARRLYLDPFGWKSLFVNEAGVAKEAARAAGETGVPRVVHISSRRAGAVGDLLGAMKALCEELFLHQETQFPETTYAAIRIGALLDSRNGRFATLENQIRAGAAVQAPPAEVRAKFVPTWRWAEQILHAARLAWGGELFEPDSGIEFSPRQVAEEAVELANLFPGDVVIEEAPEHWDEPVCGAPRQREKGWSEFGMWRLERPAADDQLHAAVSEFATLIDQRVSAESGEGAALIKAAVRQLREVPVGYGVSEEPT